MRILSITNEEEDLKEGNRLVLKWDRTGLLKAKKRNFFMI